MSFQKILNKDCFEGMKEFKDKSINLVLTSPFYNTSSKATKTNTLSQTGIKKGSYPAIRYDEFVDNMTDEEYYDFTLRLFAEFDRLIVPNGVVLYNVSYGVENPAGMFINISNICQKSNWTIADVIAWKKPSAMPNNVSNNRLTRIVEYVFVLCRKSEDKTFYMNKKILYKNESGQNIYDNIYNYVEARNNDGCNSLNKATYSTELCKKLLHLYADTKNENFTVYDPFMGTGTTAAACKEMNLNCLGTEISKAQVEYATRRLANTGTVIDLFS